MKDILIRFVLMFSIFLSIRFYLPAIIRNKTVLLVDGIVVSFCYALAHITFQLLVKNKALKTFESK